MNDRHLLIILIQREDQIRRETKQADSKVTNTLKHFICKSGKQKVDSKNMTLMKKSNVNNNREYTVNHKSVKVNDVMKDVIDCKLEFLLEMGQFDFLDGLVKDGYLTK